MSVSDSYLSLKNVLDISVIPDYVIKLEDSFWVMLKSQHGTVEGKLYLSKSNLSKLVIFEPGFPGSGSTQFEQLWLDNLLKNDYSVFLARHSGTIINGKYSANYINCPERQALSQKVGFNVLGNKIDNSIGDWLSEPQIALDVLSPHFSDIVLCGHSFGPLALFYSLINFSKDEPLLCKKVNRVVSLSGSLGIFREKNNPFIKIWYDHLNTNWARERVEIGDVKKNTEIFYKAHNFINKKVGLIPKNIEFLAVVPWGDSTLTTDEIVHPIESLEFITLLGHGYLIVDKKEWGNKETGRMVHDMEALPADIFLNLVSLEWLPKHQISVLT